MTSMIQIRRAAILGLGGFLFSGVMALCAPDPPLPAGPEEPTTQGSLNTARLAGTYIRSYGRCSKLLMLTADGRYSARTAGDADDLARSEGTLQLEGTELRFSGQQDGTQEPLRADDRPLHVVIWGGRIYLVAEEELDTFVKAVNEDTFLRWHRIGRPSAPSPPFGYQPDNDKGRVYGVPGLPQKWRASLRKTVIVGLIKQINKDKTVRLNVGRKHGVRLGMRFDVLADTGRTAASVEIVTVMEATAQAKVLGDGTTWRGAVVLANVPLTRGTSMPATMPAGREKG